MHELRLLPCQSQDAAHHAMCWYVMHVCSIFEVNRHACKAAKI